MKVYNNPFSGAGFKVTAVVNELALSNVELITVDLGKGQHQEPWFRAINPHAKVPALVDGDMCLFESNAIITYLGALKPESGLVPTDPRGLAEVQKWLHWHSSTFYPDAMKINWNTYYQKVLGHPKDEKTLAEGRELVARDLKAMDGALQGREYLTGKLTVADFSLVSALLMRDVAGIDLTPFPNVKAWAERMEARPSLKKARPPV
ncbi:glutathione S-transferase family protein [Hyalangium minutum]|uniref:Glutathione S-transferase n=1 Tax=Hyalangium minutum TaxID=394096 RepID=A0A085WL05_9BACT|nr:glutathione S-transferase family protein [Hyalangium minutum]KFE68368.1 Glutathione S-transferase [Hyalangium minutum]